MISKKVGIPLCIIVGIVLAFLVMFASDTWGHDTPEIRNGDETHILTREWKTSYRKDRHWHEDADAGGAGAWDKCIAEAYDEDTDSYGLCEGRIVEEPEPPPPSRPVRTSTPTSRGTQSGRTSAHRSQIVAPTLLCDALISRDGLRSSEVCHEWDFRESSFVGIPVLPDSVETIDDLWIYFRDLTGREIDIKFLISGWLWQTYEGYSRLGEIPITPHMGIGVNERTIGFIDSPMGIIGNQVQGETVILEKPKGAPHRYHFVGFPESPANFPTFGDLLVRGVSHVRRRILVDGQLDYQHIYKTSNEDADEMIQPGDAVVMLITREVTLDLSGSVAAAPSIKRKGTLAMSWGAMKDRQ